MTKNYQELLEQLVNKEIESFQINPAEFMDFQAIYMKFESRKRITGEADVNGVITYKYENGAN
ncbi:hypothetical protein [Lentilactobacillus kribbianus]|uniref:hypothetical protein n=1 Tax=Lentilactobacillus kribbianus TaxID=2729622 RepID=UPI0015554FCD|nr:hypothetical protein [Lentilactobacillus kribbianus]